MKYFFHVCIFTLVSLTLSAQEVNILKKESHLGISINNKKLEIEESHYLSKEFIKNVNLHTQDAIYYSLLNPLSSFEAYTMVPNKKGKYKNVLVKVTEEKDIVEPGIFYGGYQKKEFAYPSVIPNSIAVLDYKNKILDPHLVSSFYFDDRHGVDFSKYSVSFPSNVSIKFNLFNTDDLEVDFQEKKEKNITTYSWEIKNLGKRIYNIQSPSSAYFAPHLIVRIDSYTINGKIIPVSGDTDDLFKWYNELVLKIPDHKDINLVEDQVNKLIAGIDNDLEKVTSIYKWVQSNIAYVAFEDGMAGFIPRASGDVYSKKYGDCKDMANLLKTMLEMADIPSFLTWVGTNDRPYTYNEVPCTATDNHMICAIKVDDEFVFLDPTNNYLEYGKSPMLLQGKEALVRINEDEYKVIKIKETAPEDNKRKDVLALKLDGDNIQGKVVSKLGGYEKELFYYAKLSSEYNNDTNFAQGFLALGKKSSKYENLIVDEKKDNVQLSFDGLFKNDVIDINNKIYVNLNMDPSSKDYQIEDLDTRVHPIQSNFKHSYEFKMKLEIPEGFKVDFLPEEKSVDFGFCKLYSHYSIKDNEVIYEKEIVSNYLLLGKDKFEEYGKFYEALLKINQQKIILKQL